LVGDDGGEDRIAWIETDDSTRFVSARRPPASFSIAVRQWYDRGAAKGTEQ
jgi:hypothetical protein